jgi:hypothetical protein
LHENERKQLQNGSSVQVGNGYLQGVVKVLNVFKDFKAIPGWIKRNANAVSRFGRVDCRRNVFRNRTEIFPDGGSPVGVYRTGSSSGVRP